ncbi:MAG: NAD(P) transhydrogenase subunit alpha [Actinomycetia bacterium]|nr:NAD(P) transhydrogenase subunit alpha [Actinomycetes bacterium]
MSVITTAVLTAAEQESADYSQLALLTIFVLSVFLGFEVISKVSAILHTPLMSGANAIHGIVLVGAILVTANATHTLELVIGTLAIVLSAINLVGGFVVTDRMLEMFKSKPTEAKSEAGSEQ